MVIDIDDAWAEDELERQLRSLTPIDCLEEAEQKLNQLRLSCDESISSHVRGKLIHHRVTTNTINPSCKIAIGFITHKPAHG